MIAMLLLKLALLASWALVIALVVALGFERARRQLAEDLLDAREPLDAGARGTYGSVMKAKINPKAIHPESVYAIGDLVTILPEWQDDGDEGTVWEVMSEDEGKERVGISPIEWKSKFPIRPVQTVVVDMIERA